MARKETDRVVTMLFAEPPLNEGELEHRLAGVDPAELGAALVGTVAGWDASREVDEPLLLALLERAELGAREVERLERLALDGGAEPIARSLALVALEARDPERALSLTRGSDVLAVAAREALKRLVEEAAVDPDESVHLADMLEGVPEASRPRLVADAESARAEVGTPAVALYDELLRRPALASVHEAALEAIVEEGGREAVALLVELGARAGGSNAAKRFRKALAACKLRGEGARRAVGSARVGPADGEGSYALVVLRPQGKSAVTVAGLSIRSWGEVRDGIALHRVTRGEADAVLAHLEAGGVMPFVDLRPEVAAAMAERATERTLALGEMVPADAAEALALFRLVAPAQRLPHEGLAPAPAAGLDELRELLSAPWCKTWLFDERDLAEAEVEPPDAPDQADDRWFAAAAQRLAGTHAKARLVAMCEHQACWHVLRGETAEARLCLAAGRATAESFAESTLVRAMLERSLEDHFQAREEERSEDAEPFRPNPGLRRYLKNELFVDVLHPTSRDLAVLDLTEVLVEAVDLTAAELPNTRRPRSDVQLALAHAAARRFVEVATSDDVPSMLAELEAAMAASADLPAGDVELLARGCLVAAAGFVTTVCTACPVACFEDLDRGAAGPFFAEAHPAELRREPPPRPPAQKKKPAARARRRGRGRAGRGH